MNAQLTGCEPQLSGQRNFVDGSPCHGGSLLRSMTNTPAICGVDHGVDFVLPLDKGNEDGFVSPLDYKVAAIVTLAKPEDPRPIDSRAMIPHISHISFLIIGHSWCVASQ